jgi:hypothetical protein
MHVFFILILLNSKLIVTLNIFLEGSSCRIFFLLINSHHQAFRHEQIMRRSHRFVKPLRNYTRVCLLFLIVSLIIVIILQHANISCKLKHALPSDLVQYDEFCSDFAGTMALQHPFSISHHLTSHNKSIPCSYYYWQSISIMSRPLTPCEHALFIHCANNGHPF